MTAFFWFPFIIGLWTVTMGIYLVRSRQRRDTPSLRSRWHKTPEIEHPDYRKIRSMELELGIGPPPAPSWDEGWALMTESDRAVYVLQQQNKALLRARNRRPL